MLNKYRGKRGYIFSDKYGEPLKDTVCQNNLYRICEEIGLKKTTWHVLRHTFASHLIGAGASIKAIQELLGHRDIQTTMRYAHLAPSALKDTISLLEKTTSIDSFGQPVVNRQKEFTKILNTITSHNS
jgi:site-specific recombinase XerD